MKHSFILAVLVAWISSIVYAQAPPCPNGTLANVLGTSCTIGNLTFNFQNIFQGGVETTDLATNVVTSNPLPPDAVGFIPVQTGNQTGFLLKTDFVDNANGTGLSGTSHAFVFAYTVQVNGAFEILGENAKLSGSITQVSLASITAFDDQCFTNGLCLMVDPEVAFGVPPFPFLINNPSASATLNFPALASNGAGGLPFTTGVISLAAQGSEALLDSALFQYTVLPQTPPPAELHYKTIDSPQEVFTLATAINNRGNIGGFVEDFSGAVHGYIGNPDDNNLTLIDFPGATATFVNGINDNRDAVGLYIDTAGVVHGFALRDGSYSTIDFPNSIFNSANAINDAGEIAGFFQDSNFGVHGYRLNDGNFTIIDDPNAFPGSNGFPTFTEVFSINNLEEVVGLSTDRFGLSHSFLLSNGVFHRIDVPGAAEGTAAAGLNDFEQVVGQFTDINGKIHGFLLNNSTFGTVDFPSATITEPSQINSSGFIVGTYADNNGLSHSFIARPTTENDSTGSDATTASANRQNGPAPLKPRPAVPCPITQPVQANQPAGMLTCNSPH